MEFDALGGGGLKIDGSMLWKFLVGTQSARSRDRVGSLETVLRHLGAKMARANISEAGSGELRNWVRWLW